MAKPMTAKEASRRADALEREVNAFVGPNGFPNDPRRRDIVTLRAYADMLDSQTVDQDSIPMPQSVDYARKMHCLAEAYLKTRDPEYKSRQTMDREAVKDSLREICAMMFTNALRGTNTTEQREPLKEAVLDEATDRILALRPAVPDGMVMVPKEITDEMTRAWCKEGTFARGYRAMLSAAPTAVKPDPDVSGLVGALESDAIRDIRAERQRQIDKEGWTPEHDDDHGDGEMAAAAGLYALEAARPIGQLGVRIGPLMLDNVIAEYWPWAQSWWKPKDARSNLVRAGALIVAEIERLDRLSTFKGGE